MKQIYQYQDKAFPIELTATGKTQRATLGGRVVEVELIRSDAGRLDLLIDGKPVSAVVSVDGARRWVTVNGQTLQLTRASQARKSGGHEEPSAGQLLAPMPGQVRAVQTAPGQAVSRGQTLVIVEAMKMEIKVAAPFDGKVKALPVQVGQTVEKEQILVEIVP
jgi:biotin carboxyl carrier protein